MCSSSHLQTCERPCSGEELAGRCAQYFTVMCISTLVSWEKKTSEGSSLATLLLLSGHSIPDLGCTDSCSLWGCVIEVFHSNETWDYQGRHQRTPRLLSDRSQVLLFCFEMKLLNRPKFKQWLSPEYRARSIREQFLQGRFLPTTITEQISVHQQEISTPLTWLILHGLWYSTVGACADWKVLHTQKSNNNGDWHLL